ncbi:MAG: FTR1 family protein [Gammaproteobacteria bacterium]|nr:FTR1 family protein [Gammaproteobacteria bacterium]
MLATALVVFREVLEAALVIGIACAATRGVPRRATWVALGIVAGTLGACLVAGFAEAIADAASGMGQEVFNAGVLLAAVLMLGWHNVWMARHGREMAAEMSRIGRDVQSGARPLYALGAVIALAVLREGSEVVLFLYGMAAGGSTSAGLLGGSALGLAGGAAMGAILYFGLLKVPMRHFFTVTGWMILLLAAGMASQAAGFLIQADLLPPLGARIWDTSHLISAHSLAGQVLRALVGYEASPAGTQLVFYVVTLLTIGSAMKLFGRPLSARAAVAALALAAVPALMPDPAYAGPADKVYRPVVELGETELEFRGGYIKDDGPANTAQAYVFDLGYGFTPWLFSEIVAEVEKEPGGSLEVEELEWENIIQLTEPGQYFVDFGLFAEAKVPLESGLPYALEIGPMFQKEIGRTVTNLNVLAERQFGDNADGETEIGYRLQSRYRTGAPLDVGVQAFGEEDAHLVGPALFGQAQLGGGKKLKYDAGLLFGATDDAEDLRVRWQVEYEF